MYFKRLFDNNVYVIALAILYTVNIVLVTIGFFTPFWLRRESFEGTQQYIWEYNTAVISTYLNKMFYLVLTTLCTQYLNFSMTLGAFLFKLHKNRIFLSFWSITFGTLYPIGAILILVGTIMLEVEYKSQVGFSTILGTISGGLMLLFYIGLRFYNDQFVKYSIQKSDMYTW